jgi:hypothetical protein
MRRGCAAPDCYSHGICLGDYRTYAEIDEYLREKDGKGGGAAAFAEWPVPRRRSVIAPNMVPEWLKAGDSAPFSPGKAQRLYLRAKYLHCVRQPDAMLPWADALSLCAPNGESHDRYLLRHLPVAAAR